MVQHTLQRELANCCCIYFVKNGKNEIQAKIRLCIAGSILMPKNLKYTRGKVRSKIGSHLTERDLILLISISK